MSSFISEPLDFVNGVERLRENEWGRILLEIHLWLRIKWRVTVCWFYFERPSRPLLTQWSETLVWHRNDCDALWSFSNWLRFCLSAAHSLSPLIRSTSSVHAHERSQTDVTSHAPHSMRMGWAEASVGGIKPSDLTEKSQAGRYEWASFTSVCLSSTPNKLNTVWCVQTQTRGSHLRLRSAQRGLPAAQRWQVYREEEKIEKKAFHYTQTHETLSVCC